MPSEESTTLCNSQSKRKVYHATDDQNFSAPDEARGDRFSNGFRHFEGFLLIFLSSALFTLSFSIVKKLDYLSPEQLSMVMNTAMWVSSLPIAVFSVTDVFGPKEDRPMLVARGFLYATALYLDLASYRYLPLAEAAVILSTVPAVTSVLARVYLKEPCGVVQCLAIAATVAGVLLSVRPPGVMGEGVRLDSNRSLGLAAAAGCVVLYSASFVVLRKERKVHCSTTLVYSGLIGMVETGLLGAITGSSRFGLSRCGWDQAMVVLSGVLGFLGFATSILAVQRETASMVSVWTCSLDVVMAVAFDALLFGVSPDVYGASGACVVVLAVSVLGLKKWAEALPEDSKARERLRWLLL